MRPNETGPVATARLLFMRSVPRHRNNKGLLYRLREHSPTLQKPTQVRLPTQVILISQQHLLRMPWPIPLTATITGLGDTGKTKSFKMNPQNWHSYITGPDIKFDSVMDGDIQKGLAKAG